MSVVDTVQQLRVAEQTEAGVVVGSSRVWHRPDPGIPVAAGSMPGQVVQGNHVL